MWRLNHKSYYSNLIYYSNFMNQYTHNDKLRYFKFLTRGQRVFKFTQSIINRSLINHLVSTTPRNSCTMSFATSNGTTLSPIAMTWKCFPHYLAEYSLKAVEHLRPHLLAAIPIPIPDPQTRMPLSSGLIYWTSF